ncbi:TPA: hypothetical protein R0C45_002189 [Kluyvera ascorbata F0526]|jgi:hypothetical protein|uniref:hypothetical protein n=1 Tax=Kluyvera ascorbata TaxID=51288 RepID=UPI002929D79A|nr:hypothetical protein [Kluyvera ascorbata]MEB6390902.1 hypothetical protein [Kluyvera ascorbata]HEB4874017.1 hypothetical protein [Kluyvera ascorbata F0526]HED3063714.1 hypothetical protein [Kluyvera ascorbata]
MSLSETIIWRLLTASVCLKYFIVISFEQQHTHDFKDFVRRISLYNWYQVTIVVMMGGWGKVLYG